MRAHLAAALAVSLAVAPIAPIAAGVPVASVASLVRGQQAEPPAKPVPATPPPKPDAQPPQTESPPAKPDAQPAKTDAPRAPAGSEPAPRDERRGAPPGPHNAATQSADPSDEGTSGAHPAELPAVLESELHADFAAPWSADAYDAYVARIAHVFPDLVQLQSIGKSRAGRDLWVLTIGDARAGDPGRKPALCLSSAFAAPSMSDAPSDSRSDARAVNGDGPQAALFATAKLLVAARARPDLAAILRDSTLYVLPAVDPDAACRSTTAPAGSRAGGCQLDRNFPVGWQPWGDAPSPSGPYPLSEPETRSVAQFLTARANVAAIVLLERETAASTAKPAAQDPPSDDRDACACDRWCASAALARDDAVTRAAGGSIAITARSSSDIERRAGDFTSFCDAFLGLSLATVATGDGAVRDTTVGPAPAGYDPLPGFVEAAWRKLPRLLVDVPKIERLRPSLWMIDVGISNPGLLATLPSRLCDGSVARSVWVKASGAKLIAAAAKREHATSFEALRTQDGGAPIGQLAGEERLVVRLVVEGSENAALEIALSARRAGEKKVTVTLQ